MTEIPGTTSDTFARPQVRIAIADSRRLIAEALAALIRTMGGFEVVDVFRGVEEPREIVARDPGVVLVGIGVEESCGLRLVRALRQVPRPVEIVLLADVLSPGLVRFVLDHRVNGLLRTDTAAGDLAACLGRVAAGHAVLPADWQAVLEAHGDDPVGSLSDRQLEVLRLVAEGYSYEEIGRRLFISSNTVKFHLRSIYVRLGVRNRVAAARMLSEHGAADVQAAHGSGTQPRADDDPPGDEPIQSG